MSVWGVCGSVCESVEVCDCVGMSVCERDYVCENICVSVCMCV